MDKNDWEHGLQQKKGSRQWLTHQPTLKDWEVKLNVPIDFVMFSS